MELAMEKMKMCYLDHFSLSNILESLKMLKKNMVDMRKDSALL